MENSKLENFKNELFKQAKDYGFTDGEVYGRTAKVFEVEAFKGEIKDYKNSSSLGLCFRGTYNGKMGYAYTERVEEDVIASLIKSAAENAEIIEDADVERLYPGDDSYPEAHTYFDGLNSVTATEKIEAALALSKAVEEADSRIKNVPGALVGTGEDEIFLANTHGLNLSHKRNFVLSYALADAAEGETTKSAFETWYGTDWARFSPTELAERTAAKAVSYLGAESIKSGKYAVVINNEMTAALITAFTPAFFAENAQKGFSLLKGKEGQKTAAHIVTLRDDGICAESLGSLPFDGEGVATQNKAVIDKGILQTLLYTTKSAAKENKKSTGNGFRQGVQGGITTACANFYIVPGNMTEEALLEEMGDGLLITELEGLHAGTNVISGDFSLSASGFLIEGGKKVRPVEQITAAGNFFNLLTDIIGIGDNLRFDMPSRTGTIGAPSVLVKSLDISGL